MGNLTLQSDGSEPDQPTGDQSVPQSREELEEYLDGKGSSNETIQTVLRYIEIRESRWQQSKEEALNALSDSYQRSLEDFALKLNDKENKFGRIVLYFEALAADLQDRSRRDSLTKLLNMGAFNDRIELYMKRARANFCALGIVDVHKFKLVNDTFGHTVGDLVLQQVTALLHENIRSDVFVGRERRAHDRDITVERRVEETKRHYQARWGGDEFCFLIPDVEVPSVAVMIAQRYSDAVSHYDWSQIHPNLKVRVNVGVICVKLGPLEERQSVARQLCRYLKHWADQKMYEAKSNQSTNVYHKNVAISKGELVELPDDAL